MEVILRQDVDKLGRRGDVVKVAEGYGRNFLLPRGLAMQVNEANKAMIAKERKGHEQRMAKEKAEFQAVADRIASLRYIAPRKVGENDALYGSVTSGDIADFLKGKSAEAAAAEYKIPESYAGYTNNPDRVKLNVGVIYDELKK